MLTLGKVCWIQYSWYWSGNCLLTLDRVFETSRRFGFSTRSLGHVSKTSSWEAETLWIASKHDPKWVNNSHFNTLFNEISHSSVLLMKPVSLCPCSNSSRCRSYMWFRSSSSGCSERSAPMRRHWSSTCRCCGRNRPNITCWDAPSWQLSCF